MQLVRNGNRCRGAISVLADNEVGFATARVVTFEGIGSVQQDDHVGVLF